MANKISRPHTNCPTCKGSGKIPLTDAFWGIYHHLARSRKGATCAEIHAALETGVRPMQYYSNKLGILEDMKLIERSKKPGGGKFIYAIVKL